MQCVILAGGLGTRMRPMTQKIPKALLDVNGVPFADHQLKWLAQSGVTDVVYSIGYKGEMIEEHVGDGTQFGLRSVTYVSEGKELMGTAGALRIAADQGALAENFLVLYGDSFLPIDFKPVFKTFLDSGLPALMTVYQNQDLFDQSNVVFEDGKILIYDKSRSLLERPRYRHIDYGLTALQKKIILDQIPQSKKMDLAVLFTELSQKGLLAGYEVRTRFYEIGSQQGLKDLEGFLKNPAV